MMGKIRPRWAGVLAAVLTLCGCGTVGNLTDGGATSIYGGVARDVDAMVDTCTFAPNAVVYFGGLLATAVDTPLSVVGDTVTLPYVVPVSLGWLGGNQPVTPVLPPTP